MNPAVSPARALVDHTLDEVPSSGMVHYELRPLRDGDGATVEGLYNAWITLDNPRQLNSYTTGMVKEVILAFRRASMERRAVAVVFTSVGDRAFCTGGNTKEYADYYAGRPLEYRQYMRLFNDMVTSILTCDKPVINRVNGMRIGGGQEIGMACDFSIAADTARFGQAGPKHGSAPDGGSTDFLHLYTGIGYAMESCVLCEPVSAHKALRLGIVNAITPVLKHDGRFIPNPLVRTDCAVDDFGRPCLGEPLTGEAKARGKERLAACTVDHERLDAEVERFCTRLSETMPDCTSKTLESLRKKKLEHWQQNCETNRAWLSLNMMTEAKAGFRAFESGVDGRREVDFHALRRALADGHPFDDALIARISPGGEGGP